MLTVGDKSLPWMGIDEPWELIYVLFLWEIMQFKDKNASKHSRKVMTCMWKVTLSSPRQQRFQCSSQRRRLAPCNLFAVTFIWVSLLQLTCFGSKWAWRAPTQRPLRIVKSVPPAYTVFSRRKTVLSLLWPASLKVIHYRTKMGLVFLLVFFSFYASLSGEINSHPKSRLLNCCLLIAEWH